MLDRTPPKHPLMGGATVPDLTRLATDIAFFGAPHGTPYEGIDNRAHEGTAEAVRSALKGDSLDSFWQCVERTHSFR